MTRSFQHLGFDPTPGDPDQVSTLARNLADLHGELTRTVTELDRIDCGYWKGEAAKAFVAHIDHDVTPLIKKAHTSFGRAADALSGWSDQLQRFQAEADALEREAAAKQGALDQARTAAGLPPDTPPDRPHPQPEASPTPDSPADAAAETKKKQAVSDANDALDGVRHRAEELHHRYTQAAKSVSHELDKAGDIAPDKPGLLHRIAHSVEGAWNDTVKWVKDHADLIKMLGDMLSALTGILAAIAIFTAPFEPIGAIFAGAALISGAATLATHLVAMAAGADVSWLTLGMDVVSVFPGIGGFAKGAKLAKFGKVLDQASALRLAEDITAGGGRLSAVAVRAKKFVFFATKADSWDVVMKGSGLIGRGRAGIEGAIQFERNFQFTGTKPLNTVLKALGRDPLEGLARPARIVDATSKVVSKVPAAFEIHHDVKTFGKDHPQAAHDIKTAAKALAWVVSEGPG
ncbi:WXG100 family type VII secretion target [Streptomyces sp. NPDC020917]|uniref:WXG100 family type VII secretion target n=1 Tax=Streptomyces sp. NPDC020917 TaxID=3365102 RepID=UPI00378F07E6